MIQHSTARTNALFGLLKDILLHQSFQESCIKRFIIYFLHADTSYHLAVKTGEMFTAGTDANVYFQLIGSEGETEKIQLRQGGKAEKRFEKGRLDKFIVETVDVGTVGLSHYQFLRFSSLA